METASTSAATVRADPGPLIASILAVGRQREIRKHIEDNPAVLNALDARGTPLLIFFELSQNASWGLYFLRRANE